MDEGVKLKKPATIYDIAEKTGFAANTVSRVLNNKGYISETTRQAVLDAARELNYTPNEIAKSLKNAATKHILLAVPFVKESFNFDLITSIQSIVRERGYLLVLLYTEASEKAELEAVDILLRNHADALILLTMGSYRSVFEKLKGTTKPVVVGSFYHYNHDSEAALPFDYICVDTKNGIYNATKHLIDQGHKNIAYAGNNLGLYEGRERYNGFVAAMESAGLTVNPENVLIGTDQSEMSGYQLGLKLAKMENRPTAVCTGTDLIAIGIYRAFEEKGIRIPEEISIVGMDNIEACTLVRPRLSSVAVEQAQVGEKLVDLIFDRLSGHRSVERQLTTLQPKLIVRDSSVGCERL